MSFKTIHTEEHPFSVSPEEHAHWLQICSSKIAVHSFKYVSPTELKRGSEIQFTH